MVKTLKIFFLQTQESFGAEFWYIASRTQGLPSSFVMTVSGPLTFLRQGQICDSMHLHGENVLRMYERLVAEIDSVRLKK